MAFDLTPQLTKAVKRRNLLVSCKDDRPRLVMIDSGISVSVDSPADELWPDTQIQRFVGTPQWVAREVGTEHGPPQSYIPICAGLWQRGQLLLYLASQSGIRDPGLLQLATEVENLMRGPGFGLFSDRYSMNTPKLTLSRQKRDLRSRRDHRFQRYPYRKRFRGQKMMLTYNVYFNCGSRVSEDE